MTNSVSMETENICGIVMPISAIDGCDENHWQDVLSIIQDTLKSINYESDLVSNSDEVGVIQKRIVQNLYTSKIVIVDVSGKNSNVMFELGMRLAFDKPTIIIKDDKTTYSFDSAPIEHIEYPRDLRFNKITDFKKRLAAKVLATIEASNNDPSYTTFLKHFGEFKVAKLETKEVSSQEYFLDELKNIRKSIQRLELQNNRRNNSFIFENDGFSGLEYRIKLKPETDLKSLEDSMKRSKIKYIFTGMEANEIGGETISIRIPTNSKTDKNIFLNAIHEYADDVEYTTYPN